MNLLLTTNRQLKNRWPQSIGFALIFACGQVATVAATPAPAAPPPAAPAAVAPAAVNVTKSVFLDDPKVARDPFFPKSERRQKITVHATNTTNAAPQPTTLLSQLTLKGFSNATNRRLALINGTTFEAGELADVRIGSQTVKVRCREIRQESVLVSIEGMNETKELQLRKGI